MAASDEKIPIARTRTLMAFALFGHFLLVLTLPYVIGVLTGRSGGEVAQSSRALIGFELVVGLAAVVAVAVLAISLATRPAARVAWVNVPLVPAFVLIAAAMRTMAQRPDAAVASLDVFALGALAVALTLSATATAVSFCGLRSWSTSTFWAVLLPGAAVVFVFLSLALRSGACAGLVAVPALVGTFVVAISAASASESLRGGDGVGARESTSNGLIAATLALAAVALAAVAAGALDLDVRARAGSFDVGTARGTIASAWMVALGIVSGLVGGFSRRTALVGLAAQAIRAPLVVIGFGVLIAALLIRSSFAGLTDRWTTLPHDVHASAGVEPAAKDLSARADPVQRLPRAAATSVSAGATTASEPSPAPTVPEGTIQSVSGAGVTIRVLGVDGGGLLVADAVAGLARRVDAFSRCASESGSVDLRVFVEPSGGVTALKPRGATRPSALATCTMLALYKVGFAPHGGVATVDVQFDYRPN